MFVSRVYSIVRPVIVLVLLPVFPSERYYTLLFRCEWIQDGMDVDLRETHTHMEIWDVNIGLHLPNLHGEGRRQLQKLLHVEMEWPRSLRID